MTYYDYNGVYYDIDTNDPTEARAKIQEHLAKNPPAKSAGEKFMEPLKNMSVADWEEKSLIAPWAKAAVPGVAALTSMYKGTTPTQETTDAYKNLYGKGEALAGGVKNLVTSPVETVSKIAGSIADNPAGFAGEAVKGIVYDPEQLFVPGVGKAAETIARPIAATGRAISGAVKPTVGTVIQMPGDIVKGAVKGALGEGDALIPLGKTYIPPEIIQAVKDGKMSFQEAQQYARPISELPTTPVERAALAVAGKEFPVKGRGFEAFGQRLGQTYEQQPWKLAVDIGIPAMTGVPISPFTMGRGIQAGADWLLARKGFSPMNEIEDLAAKNVMKGPKPVEVPPGVTGPVVPTTAGPEWYPPGQAPNKLLPISSVPQLEYKPSGSTMYVGPTGGASTNLNQSTGAYLSEKYNLGNPPTQNTPPAATSQPTPKFAEPAPVATQSVEQGKALIEKLRAQKALEQQQRWAEQSGGSYTPPAAEVPAVREPLPAGPIGGAVAPTDPLEALRSRLKPQTAEELAAVEAYNKLSPKEKAAQTRSENAAKKTPPKDVSMMLSPEQVMSKADFEKNVEMIARLKGEPVNGSYREGNKIITVTETVNPFYNTSRGQGRAPNDLLAGKYFKHVEARDAVTGERVPVGKDWTATDPEPSLSILRKKFKKD